ncbi:hypothetical protein V4S36_10670 [Enterococcus cecorum]|uniref:hypothetical protein n=1 Tax=Enterococcus cecorum TaxID=44008 RepID=UPI0032638AA3
MKLNINNIFFYKCYIGILMIIYMLGSTSLSTFNESIVHDTLQYIALFFIVACIFTSKFSLKKLAELLTLNIIGIICYISSGLSGILFTVLAITVLPKGKLEEILKYIFKVELFLFICIIISSIVGIIPNLPMIVNKGSFTVQTFSYGFSHPNMLAAQATSLLFLYICINIEKLTKWHIFFSYVIIFLIFNFSKGRTSLILGLVTVFLISLRKKDRVKSLVLKIIPYSYIIVLLSLIVIFYLFNKYGENNEFIRIINDGVFNGRIGLAYRSLKVYPVTIFGKMIDLSYWNQWQYFSLDNGQVMLLLEYGIAGFLAYFWFIQQTLNKLKLNKEVVLSIVMMALLIWSMYEGTMYFIGKNFTLLFWASSEYGSIKKKR